MGGGGLVVPFRGQNQCRLVSIRVLKSKMIIVRIIAITFRVLSRKNMTGALYQSTVSLLLPHLSIAIKICQSVSLCVVSELVPLRGKIHLSHAHQMRSWYILGCFS